jgi:prophage regulatory protein
MPNDPLCPSFSGLLRLPEVLKLFPVSKSTWWQGVSAGRYPKPIKIGPRCTAWRASDIRALIAKVGQ